MQTDGTTQNEICQEILKQWELCQAAAREEKSDETVAVDIQIARIMEQQALCVIPQKKQSEEERKLKQSILSQYAQVLIGEISHQVESDSDLHMFRFLTGKKGMKMMKVGMTLGMMDCCHATQTPKTSPNWKDRKKNPCDKNRRRRKTKTRRIAKSRNNSN